MRCCEEELLALKRDKVKGHELWKVQPHPALMRPPPALAIEFDRQHHAGGQKVEPQGGQGAPKRQKLNEAPEFLNMDNNRTQRSSKRAAVCEVLSGNEGKSPRKQSVKGGTYYWRAVVFGDEIEDVPPIPTLQNPNPNSHHPLSTCSRQR